MSNYFDHNDAKGRDARYRVQAAKADRARMYATMADRDFGCVTLFMGKHDVRNALAQAARMRHEVRS